MMKEPGLFSDIGKKARDLLTKVYFSDQKASISTNRKETVDQKVSICHISQREKTGPGFFSEFGKRARDLLTKDYFYDQDPYITTYKEPGVMLNNGYKISLLSTVLTQTAVQRAAFSTGDLAYQCRYNKALFDVSFDTESTRSATLTLDDFLPSTKAIASVKLQDYSSGKLEVQYYHHHAIFTTAVGLNQTPIVDLSLTLGTPAIAIGAEASYKAAGGVKLAKCTLGMRVTDPDSCVALILGDKGDTLKASYIHNLDQLQKSSIGGEVATRFSTKEITFTVGGSCAIDDQTSLKFKLNNRGKLGVVMEQEVVPKSFVTVTAEYDTVALDKAPKCGLALALKP